MSRNLGEKYVKWLYKGTRYLVPMLLSVGQGLRRALCNSLDEWINLVLVPQMLETYLCFNLTISNPHNYNAHQCCLRSLPVYCHGGDPPPDRDELSTPSLPGRLSGNGHILTKAAPSMSGSLASQPLGTTSDLSPHPHHLDRLPLGSPVSFRSLRFEPMINLPRSSQYLRLCASFQR